MGSSSSNCRDFLTREHQQGFNLFQTGLFLTPWALTLFCIFLHLIHLLVSDKILSWRLLRKCPAPQKSLLWGRYREENRREIRMLLAREYSFFPTGSRGTTHRFVYYYFPAEYFYFRGVRRETAPGSRPRELENWRIPLSKKPCPFPQHKVFTAGRPYSLHTGQILMQMHP